MSGASQRGIESAAGPGHVRHLRLTPCTVLVHELSAELPNSCETEPRDPPGRRGTAGALRWEPLQCTPAAGWHREQRREIKDVRSP
jgi:hypothetical protein